MAQSSIDEVREYYKQRASTNVYATSPDFNLREIEIDHLTQRLRDDARVLDVGCGNGYSTLCHAVRHRAAFTGIDFVPEMIEAASQMRGGFALAGTVEFAVGDVTALQFAPESFDTVISQRCLLNIPTREGQWQAIREVARVLEPGGTYLMLEGTRQGLERLNTIRGRFDLAPIPDAESTYNWFSNKFDEDEMIAVAMQSFSELREIQRFGMYYFISRVIHPLLVAPDQLKYDAPINAVARQICAQIPNYEDVGHVALFVFTK